MTDAEREREWLLFLCDKAGVLPSERHIDPVHGLCVSLPGVKKIAAITPDTAKKMEFMAEFLGWARENGYDR